MPIYSASRGAAAGAAIMAAVIALALCSPRPAAAFRGQREPNEVGAPLETSVTALKASHTAITARLPKNLQHSEPRAFAIVSQLPMVLQEAYLRTAKGYASLGMEDAERGRAGVGAAGAKGKKAQDQGDGHQAGFLRSRFLSRFQRTDRCRALTTHPSRKG